MKTFTVDIHLVHEDGRNQVVRLEGDDRIEVLQKLFEAKENKEVIWCALHVCRGQKSYYVYQINTVINFLEKPDYKLIYRRP